MSAFAQTLTNDLDLSSGNLVIEQDKDQCAAWKLTNLFLFFEGEWFKDTRQGIPYFKYVFVKSPDLGVIGTIFGQVATYVPWIAGTISQSIDFIANQRTLNATFQYRTGSGAVITGGPGKPFLITTPGNNT